MRGGVRRKKMRNNAAWASPDRGFSDESDPSHICDCECPFMPVRFLLVLEFDHLDCSETEMLRQSYGRIIIHVFECMYLHR